MAGDRASELRCDVLVVGAGVIGASCAHHLSASGHDVVVVDTLAGPAEGSTGRSFASVRAQWADPLNIELAWRSIRRLRDFPDEHGIDVGYRPTGYLYVVDDETWPAQLDAVALQREHGVPVEVLELPAAAAITDFDRTGIAGATWGPADGVVDPTRLTTAYLAMARHRGAQVLFRHGVTAADPDHRAGGWVVRAGDRTVRCSFVVNAAGGWAGQVAALAGIQLPVEHVRRNVYTTAEGALPRPVPMTIDTRSGTFLRSEGGRLLFGRARPDEPLGYNVTVDWDWMYAVLETGCERFPWLAELPLDRAGCWAGTYETTPDNIGVVGADPLWPTWIDACGFSGHGVMQSPEVGRLVAEQVTTGRITSLDATALRPGRFGVDTASAPAAMVF